MTMQISAKAEIGGVPALKVRDWLAGSTAITPAGLLRCFYRWKPTRYKPEQYLAKQVSALLHELLELGYIAEEKMRHKGDEPYYKRTKRGEEFSRASGAKRLKRETAEHALEEFLFRVQEVNKNPRFLVRITRVVVYGSFVRGDKIVGDLDLAVEYESKITAHGAKRKEIYRTHFE